MNLLDGLFKKSAPNSLEKRLKRISDYTCDLPAYLRYPDDPISQKMFESQMTAVHDRRCGYQFMLYTGIADTVPVVKQNSPTFDLNETHIFWKPDSPSCCSVSTLKSSSVKTSDLKKWVESNDRLGLLLGAMTPFLNLPAQWKSEEYHRVEMYDLGENAAYNKLHSFEESHVYCHVFSLGETRYKKFILCAKRDTVSWKVECTFPTKQETLSPVDTVPPGQIFGSFFPAEFV